MKDPPPPPPAPPPQRHRMRQSITECQDREGRPADKTPLATTDDMENRVIGTVTQEGIPDDNIQPPVSTPKSGIAEAPGHEEEPEIFRNVEVMPRFGRKRGPVKFLRQNLRTPGRHGRGTDYGQGAIC
jgi:hypothetical protein